MDILISLWRYIRGERIGMGTQLRPPTFQEEALARTLYPDLFLGPTILIQTLVRLCDVSFWQDVIDFVKMKAAGIAGVIIRAGQGGWEDLKFKVNWALARAAGLPRGSYWFYDSRKDPKQQAALWWSLIRGDTGELVHVADFEESYGGPYGSKAHIKEFLIEFQRISGLPSHRIAIYTGFFWWLARVGDDPFFKQFNLCLASYGSMAAARIPAPWGAGDLLFWQFTASGDGPAHGVSSQEIDLNWYCCDPAAYARRFPLITPDPDPIPPPNGDSMEGTVLRFTNMRADKNKNSADLGDLLAGDRVTWIVEQPGTDGLTWYQLTSATRNGQPVRRIDGKTVAEALVWAWADNIEKDQDPDPVPPTEEVVITQTFQMTGYIPQTITVTLKPEQPSQ